jgi:hypothetical protein
MKFLVESQETNSRWEMELDADKLMVNELLDSDEWAMTIQEEYLSEDWSRKPKGFVVFGLEDEEVFEVVKEIKIYFEGQGIEVDDINFITEEDLDDDYKEDDDEYEEDLLDEIFTEDY